MHLRSEAYRLNSKPETRISKFVCALFLVAALLAGGARAASAEETLDSVGKKVQDAWDKVNSYTATMNYEGSMTKSVLGMSMTMSTKGSGPFEFLKVDGKPRYRSELTNKVDFGIPIPANMQTQTILTVFDGTAVYTEMKAMGETKVIKRSPDKTNLPNAESGATLIKKMQEKGTVKLLPDEEVDKVPVYVFEVKPSPESQKGAPAIIGTTKIYLAKETGIQIKMVSLDVAQKPIVSVTYTNVKVNVKLDPTRFTYTPPPGVKVEDGWDPKSGGPAL